MGYVYIDMLNCVGIYLRALLSSFSLLFPPRFLISAVDFSYFTFQSLPFPFSDFADLGIVGSFPF